MKICQYPDIIISQLPAHQAQLHEQGKNRNHYIFIVKSDDAITLDCSTDVHALVATFESLHSNKRWLVPNRVR